MKTLINNTKPLYIAAAAFTLGLIADVITKIIYADSAIINATSYEGYYALAFYVSALLIFAARDNSLGAAAAALVIAGNLGNALFWMGQIPDFIYLNNGYAYNVADALIYSGSALVFVALITECVKAVIAKIQESKNVTA